jgi:hypothetical protein
MTEPLPAYPFTVHLESSEGRNCIITLNADGGWKGDADHLESVLTEMSTNGDSDPRNKVVLWLLLREMQRGR